MDFSEFIRRLGADPDNQDPELLRAREMPGEFREAAQASDRLEARLKQALHVAPPQDLLVNLQDISRSENTDRAPHRSRWQTFAMAASVLLVVAAAGLTWRSVGQVESLQQYVARHYAHDGTLLLDRAEGNRAENVNQVLAQFGVSLAPQVIEQVGLIKYCPTPDGKGAHLVLNTEHGAVTVIFMPDTPVTDGEMMTFDGVEAQLVALTRGSAAVIGTDSQQVASLHTLVQGAFLPGSVDA